MSGELPRLFGIIGVAYRGNRTLYVKRSMKMRNYPGVWSLPSIQFDPSSLADPANIGAVQRYVDQISAERFNGTPLTAKEFLTFGDSDENPIGMHVYLYLYWIELSGEPKLNPDYYTDVKWMTAAEYERASFGQPCGLCTRLWSDYAWLKGITDRPFIAHDASHEGISSFGRLVSFARTLSSRILGRAHAT